MRDNKYLTGARRIWVENPLYSTLFALIILVILQTAALGFDYPTFGAWFMAWTGNWLNILRNNAGVGIIAIGMTFVIISGGIDLAVGSTLVAVGAVLMVLIDTGNKGLLQGIGITGVPAYIIAVVVSIAIGTLLGQVTGLFITKGRIPPFIVTLGTMKILRSVTQHFMQGYTPVVPKSFVNIANVSIGGLMFMPILYWLIIAAGLYIVSKRTVFGRHVFAIGSNERTTRLSGINVDKVKHRVYALMGALAAVSAIVQVSRIGSMDYANAGSGYELDAIAAVIVGGTNMSGGRGSVIGTILGMLIIAVMNNFLNLMGVPPFLREAFKGAIVIAAVLLQRKKID